MSVVALPHGFGGIGHRRLNTLRAMYTTGECGREGMHGARDERAHDRQNCLHDNGGVSDIITPLVA